MLDLSGMSVIGLMAAGFFATAFSALFLRAKGLFGWLSIAGIVAVAVVAIGSLEGGRLAAAGVAIAVGLMVGGKISDRRESDRVRREKRVEQKLRDEKFK
jgi:hypothetical protein